MIDARALTSMGRAIGSSEGAITDALDTAELRVAETAVREVTKGARRHTRTGRLARSVRSHVEATGESQRVRITTGPAAHLIVAGTRPHVIRSRRALTLTRGGSVFAFRRMVHHPGTRADPFIGRALDATVPDAGHVLDAAADSILGSIVTNGRRR